MIPRNIDLTENGDFGKNQRNRIHITEVLQNIRVYNEPFLTNEEYEVLYVHEKIFGKKRHDNEKANVFYNENAYIEKLKKHCARCGRPIRHIPWKNNSLCNSCENIVEKQVFNVPWKPMYSENSSREINLAKDIFMLR